MPRELTEEEIMLDDKDPIDAINAIRREEGVDEDDLIDNDESSAAPEADEEEDDDTSGEDEADKTAEGEDDEADKTGEEDNSDEEDDSENDEDDSKADSKVKATVRTFKANGQEFNFTEDEMLQQFETIFGQSMDYTKKMQKIAPFRKMISAIEDQGITQDQLNIAIDALKGDKGALKKLMDDNKIEGYDLTDDDGEDVTYTPSNYGKDERSLEIEEITSKIQADEEYKITVNVIDEQWDGASREAILKNPNMITGLHNDIKTGLYDKVAPVAMKMKVLDGNTKSDIEYYMLAGQKLGEEAEAQKGKGKSAAELNAETQAAEEDYDKASSEAGRKRKAASTGSRADRKGVIDYLDDDNDEAFDSWYKKLQESI